MLIEEHNPFKLLHPQPQHSSSSPANFVPQLYSPQSDLSHDSSESPLSTAFIADPLNYYTHIQTKDGQPAYRNGASISPRKNGVQRDVRTHLPMTQSDPRRFFTASFDEQDACEELHSPTKNGVPTGPQLYLECDTPVNHVWSPRCVSNTFMLGQLDVICSEDTTPTPWMLKLRECAPLQPRLSCDRSWSTIATSDSLLLEDMNADSPSHSNPHSRGSDPPSGGALSASSTGTHSRSGSFTEPEHCQRTTLLKKLVGEMNCLAEAVLTTPFDQRTVSGRCRSILCKLSVLCGEEEEEEEEEEEVMNEACVKTTDKQAIWKQKRPCLDGTMIGISSPLPVTSRVTSPMRLLVCYFEILSELGDAQAEEHKFEHEYRRQYLEFVELTYEFLHALNELSKPDQTVDLADCKQDLKALSHLRNMTLMSHVIGCHSGARAAHFAGGETTEESVLQKCVDQIHTVRALRLGYLKARMHTEVTDELATSVTAQNMDEAPLPAFVSMCHDLMHHLSLAAEDKHWIEDMRDTSLSPAINSPHHKMDEITPIYTRCLITSRLLDQYLSEQWTPVQQWTDHVTSPLRCADNVFDWQSTEIAAWRQTTQLLQTQCTHLALWSDQLLQSSLATRPTTKSESDLEVLISKTRRLYRQAQERAVRLVFFERLCQLPGGLTDIMRHICDLTHQLDSDDNINHLPDFELSIRQIQHQLSVEFAFLHQLFTRTIALPDLSDGLFWVNVWISHVTEAYQHVVMDWEALRSKRQSEVLSQAFDAWTSCALGCLDTISAGTTPVTAEDILNHTDVFPMLWALSCDAQLLRETRWRVRRQQHATASNVLTEDDIPPAFVTCLAEVNRHIDAVLSACKQDPNLGPVILQKLELSLRDPRTRVVQTLIDVVWNEDPGEASGVDELRALIAQLHNYQRYWSRRFRLIQRAIHVAGQSWFRVGPAAQFVQRWIVSMCLRRDWHLKLMTSVERIVRACELVATERFPVTSTRTIDADLFQEHDLLRRKQVFIESLSFGLDVISMESVVLREGLAVCDSKPAASSPVTSSMKGTLEELKHLFNLMYRDPCLGQTNDLQMPRDKFTAHITTRLEEASQLYAHTELTLRTNWELATAEMGMDSKCASVPSCVGSTSTNVPGASINRMHSIIRAWNRLYAKSTRLNFSPYICGFYWTPISFDLGQLVAVKESTEDFASESQWLVDQLHRQLDQQTVYATESSSALGYLGTSCDRDIIDSETSNHFDWISEARHQLERMEPASVLKDSVTEIPVKPAIQESGESDRCDEVDTHGSESATDIWSLWLSSPDGNVRAIQHFQDALTNLESVVKSIELMKRDFASDGVEVINQLASEVQSLHTSIGAFGQRYLGENRPHWIDRLLQSIDQLMTYFLPDMRSGGVPRSWDEYTSQLLHRIEGHLYRMIHSPCSTTHHLDLQLIHRALRWLDSTAPNLDDACEDENTPALASATTTQSVQATHKRLETVRQWLALTGAMQTFLNSLASAPMGQSPMAVSEPSDIEFALAKLDAFDTQSSTLWSELESLWVDLQSGDHVVPPLHTLLPLARELLQNRMTVYLRQSCCPATSHQKVVKVIAEGDDCVLRVLEQLKGLLTTNDLDKQLSRHDFTSYDLSPLLPEEVDLTRLLSEITWMYPRFEVIRNELSEAVTLYPPTKMGDNRDDLLICSVDGKRPSRRIGDLLQQLGLLLMDERFVRDRADKLMKQGDKIRKLIDLILEQADEAKKTHNQLRVAVLNLTGLHLDELTCAVDELETITNLDRTDQAGHGTAVAPDHVTQYIKYAGQRLMELETCLEHAEETTRVLLLLGRGAQFWSSYSDKRPSMSVDDRAAALQVDYEHTTVCSQLTSAWTNLAQLGDRLGRIQAGLPARRSLTSSGATSDEIRFNENINHRSSQSSPVMNESSPKDRPVPLPSNTTSSSPIEIPVDAEDVRRRRLKLRDLLGSHDCVYPECKLATEQWGLSATPISGEQITIHEKVRKIFTQLVHFYACLRKDFIEHNSCSSTRNDSLATTVPCDMESIVRTRWHQNADLINQYELLMHEVDEVSSCDLPQVGRLKSKANSLKRLWFGLDQLFIDSNNNKQDQLFVHTEQLNVRDDDATKPDTTTVCAPFITMNQKCAFEQTESVQLVPLHSHTSHPISDAQASVAMVPPQSDALEHEPVPLVQPILEPPECGSKYITTSSKPLINPQQFHQSQTGTHVVTEIDRPTELHIVVPDVLADDLTLMTEAHVPESSPFECQLATESVGRSVTAGLTPQKTSQSRRKRRQNKRQANRSVFTPVSVASETIKPQLVPVPVPSVEAPDRFTSVQQHADGSMPSITVLVNCSRAQTGLVKVSNLQRACGQDNLEALVVDSASEGGLNVRFNLPPLGKVVKCPQEDLCPPGDGQKQSDLRVSLATSTPTISPTYRTAIINQSSSSSPFDQSSYSVVSEHGSNVAKRMGVKMIPSSPDIPLQYTSCYINNTTNTSSAQGDAHTSGIHLSATCRVLDGVGSNWSVINCNYADRIIEQNGWSGPKESYSAIMYTPTALPTSLHGTNRNDLMPFKGNETGVILDQCLLPEVSSQSQQVDESVHTSTTPVHRFVVGIAEMANANGLSNVEPTALTSLSNGLSAVVDSVGKVDENQLLCNLFNWDEERLVRGVDERLYIRPQTGGRMSSHQTECRMKQSSQNDMIETSSEVIFDKNYPLPNPMVRKEPPSCTKHNGMICAISHLGGVSSTGFVDEHTPTDDVQLLSILSSGSATGELQHETPSSTRQTAGPQHSAPCHHVVRDTIEETLSQDGAMLNGIEMEPVVSTPTVGQNEVDSSLERNDDTFHAWNTYNDSPPSDLLLTNNEVVYRKIRGGKRTKPSSSIHIQVTNTANQDAINNSLDLNPLAGSQVPDAAARQHAVVSASPTHFPVQYENTTKLNGSPGSGSDHPRTTQWFTSTAVSRATIDSTARDLRHVDQFMRPPHQYDSSSADKYWSTSNHHGSLTADSTIEPSWNLSDDTLIDGISSGRTYEVESTTGGWNNGLESRESTSGGDFTHFLHDSNPTQATDRFATPPNLSSVVYSSPIVQKHSLLTGHRLWSTVLPALSPENRALSEPQVIGSLPLNGEAALDDDETDLSAVYTYGPCGVIRSTVRDVDENGFLSNVWGFDSTAIYRALNETRPTQNNVVVDPYMVPSSGWRSSFRPKYDMNSSNHSDSLDACEGVCLPVTVQSSVRTTNFHSDLLCATSTTATTHFTSAYGETQSNNHSSGPRPFFGNAVSSETAANLYDFATESTTHSIASSPTRLSTRSSPTRVSSSDLSDHSTVCDGYATKDPIPYSSGPMDLRRSPPQHTDHSTHGLTSAVQLHHMVDCSLDPLVSIPCDVLQLSRKRCVIQQAAHRATQTAVETGRRATATQTEESHDRQHIIPIPRHPIRMIYAPEQQSSRAHMDRHTQFVSTDVTADEEFCWSFVQVDENGLARESATKATQTDAFVREIQISTTPSAAREARRDEEEYEGDWCIQRSQNVSETKWTLLSGAQAHTNKLRTQERPLSIQTAVIRSALPCTYFVPLALLLLFFLMLFSLLCFLHPICGAFVPWFKCMERTFLWRLFYQPIRILHFRHPPL